MDRRTSDRRKSSSLETYIPDLREILDILRRRRWLLLNLILLPTLLGLVYLSVKPAVYKATASVVLDTQEINLADFQDILVGMKFDNLTVPTEIQVISSPGLARETVLNLGLYEDNQGQLAISASDYEKDRFKNDIFQNDDIEKAGILSVDPKRYHVLKDFLARLDVAQRGSSRVIEISFTSTDPQTAAKIANAHTKQYVYSQVRAKQDQAQRLNEWLSTEIVKLKDESLRKSRAVQKFRADNNMIMGQNSEELVYQQISDIAAQLIPIEAKELDLRARNEVLEKGDAHAITEVVESKLVQDLKSRASVAAQRLQSLRADYGENHPTVVAAEKELSQIKADISREVGNIRQSIENELTTVSKQKALLQANLDQLQKNADSLQEKQISLQALQLEEAASRKILDNFLARSEEIKSRIDFTRSDVRIVSLAEIPGEPAGPGIIPLVILIVLFSAIFALAVIFTLELALRGIETPDDVRKGLHLKFLGALPKTRYPISQVVSREASDYLEEIKRICIYISTHPEMKIILVTSATGKEGKSTLIMSLAYYLNSIGKKTLVIDANTTDPMLAGVAQIKNTPGFYELLARTYTVQNVITRDAKGLDIIPAGEKGRSISDLLLAGRLLEPLEKLKAQYDYILIESASADASSDTEILARQADQVVLAVNWAKTSKRVLVKTAESLRAQSKEVPYVVLNKVKPERMQSF